MSKIKLIISMFFVFLMGLLVAKPVIAATVYIQSLPGYINYTDFKLSCSSNGTTAQFYSMKEGESWSAFGPLVDLTTAPCQVQVTGSQFGSEGKFFFKVESDGASSQTSTTLDTTGPSGVSDFGKERLNSGTSYKISWKNPLESDFVKVIIYKGTEAGFEADDGHKVAEINGNPGDTQNWTQGGMDPSKEYFFYIRALDHANNSSVLVGDSSTSTITATPTSRTGSTSGKVTVLPKEQGTGSVLGTEATPVPESTTETPKLGTVDQINQFAGQTPEPFRWILTHKKISIGVLLIIGLLVYGAFRMRKSNDL